MKPSILLIIIAFTQIGCSNSQPEKGGTKIVIPSSISIIDSLVEVCQKNTMSTFDIELLQTDNFDNMAPISKRFFETMYSDGEDYSENSFYIYSCIPRTNKYLSLIIYQKNYEGENYRVDHIDLVNIDSAGKALEKICLTTKDNAVITYEVVSSLVRDTLYQIERISSEPSFDPDLDTLYTNEYTFSLNGENRIDTIGFRRRFEVRHN